jgi:RNA-binding protein
MLTGKQKRQLRGLANKLKALFQVGKEGVSFNLFNTISDALEAHELVKISVLKNCPTDVREIAFDISSNTNSEIVQIIGKTIVIYKESEKNKKIELI